MVIPIAYRISTLGAQLCVNTQTNTVGLVLATHTYCLQFMVLPGQVIDAILSMNWLRVYGVVLDLKQRVVELQLSSSEDRMLKGSRCPRGGVNWANSKILYNN